MVMPSTKKSPAQSNLTVNAALYEQVRCELNDADNIICELKQENSELKEEIDTAEHFRDALDSEPEKEALVFEPEKELEKPNCPNGHELTDHYCFPCRPWFCAHCSTTLEPPGFRLYGCRRCDYDVCQTCLDTPGATKRPLVVKAL